MGISESHISKSSECLGRYCEALANISAESAENYLSKSNQAKPNTIAKYVTYLEAFLCNSIWSARNKATIKVAIPVVI
jgi:hypothetical protein